VLAAAYRLVEAPAGHVSAGDRDDADWHALASTLWILA
jgi:hypothetical protein